MKLGAIPAFLFLLATAAAPASAAIATLGVSNQNFTLTGIGVDANGDGQSTVSWGTCKFDGTNTSCTLTGPFTGFAGGGTYSFVLTYAGNGAFPLIAVSQSPGSNFFTYRAIANSSLVITLNESNGTTVSFYSFANFTFFYTSAATCTGVATCGVGAVGGTPGATITGPITGSFDPTPVIQPSGVISAGNYGAYSAIAPSTWIEIYGINLATTLSQTWAGTDFKGTQAPQALGGTTVTVGGKPAYVYYVSPGQVDVQVPSDITTGSQPVIVTTAGGTSLAYTVLVNATEPGLLSPAAFLINGKQYIVALFSNTLTYVLPLNVGGIATSRARVGDSITLYGIGFGGVTPVVAAGQIAQQTDVLQNNFQISFAGIPATVTYAGLAPGYVGLYQFNVTVPNVTASDTVPITYSLGGVPGPQNLVTAIQK